MATALRGRHPGADFHDQLGFRGFDAIFDKGEYAAAYSGFDGRSADDHPLDAWLTEHGVGPVDVCGIATDYCVKATALDAAGRGFDTTVLVGLTAAVAPHRLASGLSELTLAGVTLQRS